MLDLTIGRISGWAWPNHLSPSNLGHEAKDGGIQSLKAQERCDVPLMAWKIGVPCDRKCTKSLAGKSGPHLKTGKEIGVTWPSNCKELDSATRMSLDLSFSLEPLDKTTLDFSLVIPWAENLVKSFRTFELRNSKLMNGGILN